MIFFITKIVAYNFFMTLAGSGNIDKEEWLEGFVKLFAATPVLAIKIFEHLDGDKSGDISMAEIDNLFAKMDADSECFWSYSMSSKFFCK